MAESAEVNKEREVDDLTESELIENLEEEIKEFKKLMLLQKIIEVKISDPNYFI